MIGQTPFKNLSERFYRNSSSLRYYAILKIRGKQIKRSLKTGDSRRAAASLGKGTTIFTNSSTMAPNFRGRGEMSFQNIREIAKALERELGVSVPDTIRSQHQPIPAGARKQLARNACEEAAVACSRVTPWIFSHR